MYTAVDTEGLEVVALGRAGRNSDAVRIVVRFEIVAHVIAEEVEREKTAGCRWCGTRLGPERNFRVYLSVILNKILRLQMRHVIEVTK